MQKQKAEKGFTLAEVLITLAIIGVVAALTIPSVVLNYQKTQTVTKLKKVYSELSNAANLAIAEYGLMSEWDMPDSNGASIKEFADKYITPYLKISKNCGRTTACTSIPRKTLGGDISTHYTDPTSDYNCKLILNDGTLIWITTATSNQKINAYIYADINGDKSPNVVGKDVFVFEVNKSFQALEAFRAHTLRTNGRAWMMGGGTSDQCNKNATLIAGGSCGALIQADGWQIKDDYPW